MLTMKKILNGYAGLGGNRTLWEGFHVDAVEINPDVARIYQKRFPNDNVIIGDVFDFIRDMKNNLDDYFLMWFSPDCFTHSQMQKFPKSKTTRIPIPDMTSIYGLIDWLKRNYSGNWIIENVQPWYVAKSQPTVRIDRHLFWSNFSIKKTTFKNGDKWKHGKIGGVMRTPLKDLVAQYHLESVFEDLKTTFGRYTEKRYEQIIRNCVNPKIGKYILDQLINKPTLLNYF